MTDEQTARRRDERLAASFKEDPEMEALIRLRKSRPAEFAKLKPQEKMGVGFYLSAREAYQRVMKGEGNGR